jgi:5-methylthioribose kinase
MLMQSYDAKTASPIKHYTEPELCDVPEKLVTHEDYVLALHTCASEPAEKACRAKQMMVLEPQSFAVRTG